eukprot:7491236-Prorocentrum_lima.AAC.1
MAHWHPKYPRELLENEQFVSTMKKHKVSAVIKRELDNLSPVEIKTHHKEAADAKLAELKRWQDLNCFQRMPVERFHKQ